MFEEDVLVVLVAWDEAAALRQLAVPVCRSQGYDDVLPDAPEHLLHQQYTMLRPPSSKPCSTNVTDTHQL